MSGLRHKITAALHERLCGSPPSCGHKPHLPCSASEIASDDVTAILRAVRVWEKNRGRELRARIAELEGKLRQAEAAWAEFVSRVDQCCVEEFSPGSIQALVDLADDCPLSAQALTRLAEAALHLSRQRRAGLEHTAVFGDIKMGDLEILDHYVDAYLDARSGRGEGGK